MSNTNFPWGLIQYNLYLSQDKRNMRLIHTLWTHKLNIHVIFKTESQRNASEILHYFIGLSHLHIWFWFNILVNPTTRVKRSRLMWHTLIVTHTQTTHSLYMSFERLFRNLKNFRTKSCHTVTAVVRMNFKISLLCKQNTHFNILPHSLCSGYSSTEHLYQMKCTLFWIIYAAPSPLRQCCREKNQDEKAHKWCWIILELVLKNKTDCFETSDMKWKKKKIKEWGIKRAIITKTHHLNLV